MQGCSYAAVALAGALLSISQFSACASQGTPPDAPAPAGDPAGLSAETDMPSAEAGDIAAPPEPGAEAGEEATAPSAGDGSEGDRDLGQIQAIVASDQNRKPVRACYEKAKKDLPDLKGTMTIRFVLDPEGNVKSAELVPERSDIKSPEVANCAIAVIKGLKFPRSAKGMETTVNYPYNFKP